MTPATHPSPAAICHRCSGAKRGPLVPCKSCSFTPTAEQRPIAWLFSDRHLNPAELAAAAARVRAGERPDPSHQLQLDARAAMGAQPLDAGASRPLTTRQLLLLSAANLLLTPLSGVAIWWGMREERPVAARQSLRATLPVAIGLALVWALHMVGRLVA